MDKRKEWVPFVDTGEAFAGDLNPSPRSSARLLLMQASNKPVAPVSSTKVDAKRLEKSFQGLSGHFFPASAEPPLCHCRQETDKGGALLRS